MANKIALSKGQRTIAVWSFVSSVLVLYQYRKFLVSNRHARKTGPGPVTAKHSSAAGAKVKKNVAVNAAFVAQMRKLMPILYPSIWSKEAGLTASLAFVLIVRTWLDIWFSGFNGSVVHTIVARDQQAFIARMYEFALMMFPLSAVNNALKLNISALASSFRARLTHYAHNKYLKGLNFYRVSNLDGRLHNPDQLLTTDIDRFSTSLVDLFSDTAKPFIDCMLFSYKLGQALGTSAPLSQIAYFVFSAGMLRSFSPPFGRYTAQEQKLEGDLRFCHSRIITSAEEIAFYRGAEREREVVDASYNKIQRHVEKTYMLRFFNGIYDSIATKYMATMLAYSLLARPVFNSNVANAYMGSTSADPTQIMEDYSRNSGYLVNLSQAVGRIILAGRDLTRFSGLAARVSELFEVLEDIDKGTFVRTMITQDSSKSKQNLVTHGDLKGNVVLKDGTIKFDQVPIVTPNGDVLVKALSFEIKVGQNTLITGPNGCGKTSAFRILGELWPLFGGTLTKPQASSLFYVPQKPYLALGTLRDQVIYPHSRDEAMAHGNSDEKLKELLKIVHLEYLVVREGGFDAVQDWQDVLSGGEKQRIAMARLFYHKPAFAVLDECTSQVSVDVEGLIYNKAKELGITLFSVSHRHSLFKNHDWLLRFDGEGGYTFEALKDGDVASAFGFGHGKSNMAGDKWRDTPELSEASDESQPLDA